MTRLNTWFNGPHVIPMGRTTVLFGFWLLGFCFGFFGYLVYPDIADWLMAVLPTIFIDKQVAGAFLAGLAGSIVTTVAVVLWSYLSR